MQESDLRIVPVAGADCDLIDNFLTKDDVLCIRNGRFSAVAGILNDVISAVMVYEVRDESILMIHGISVATDVEKDMMRDKLIEWITGNAKDNDVEVLCCFAEDSGLEKIFQKNAYAIDKSEAQKVTVSYRDITTVKYFRETKSQHNIYGEDQIGKRTLNAFINRQTKDDPLFGAMYRPGALQRYAVVNDKIVGSVIGSVYEDGNCSIDHVYVDPSFKPVIIPVIRSFIEEARSRSGKEDFELTLSAVNEASVRLAEKLLEYRGNYQKYSVAYLKRANG